ncbi:amylo-alpha-1,6-glucosidase [Pedobacter sp. ASV1-7]|uniref:amylo-alpha-1,6-glucosidase n=1 Tax=Pedobacter sp. ASV1-7 TaxID=3145237 RepID=UPI0032E8E3D1
MDNKNLQMVEKARNAAVEVLLHNLHGPFEGLPRTAGWGYPEPYTRDLLITAFGICLTRNQALKDSIRMVLETLAENQSKNGHIPSLVHDKEDRGASDTTPLFILITAIFREMINEPGFLQDAVQRAIIWMDCQRPSDSGMVAQLPTSDWRDEQWVPGYGLFVNTLVYSYLRRFELHEQADDLRGEMDKFTITGKVQHHHVHEGLTVPHKPYYALWSYKVYSSERFDLLGNSLAVLAGVAPFLRAEKIISWVEQECAYMQERGILGIGLPPNFFPFIRPGDPDWLSRYEDFNQPGEYHNGGIWPFVCGFYIAALVAVKQYGLAEERLMALTRAVQASADSARELDFGFNEWLKPGNGMPAGQDWQSWTAAMYIYAAECVNRRETPFFEEMRKA